MGHFDLSSEWREYLLQGVQLTEVQATLVTAALALQFVAFGWRLVREIEVGDANRQTWFLVSDYFIVISTVAVVANCVVLPLAKLGNETLISQTIAIAFVIIAMYPINTAAHYRLFSKQGRYKYTAAGRPVPYITDQEFFFLFVTTVLIIGTWFVVGGHQIGELLNSL